MMAHFNAVMLFIVGTAILYISLTVSELRKDNLNRAAEYKKSAEESDSFIMQDMYIGWYYRTKNVADRALLLQIASAISGTLFMVTAVIVSF